ncbi:MAG: methylated-DNA--[protein]-cysteine S-methyltransferase [Cephaloticoccus sp.]|nr:methylated-DNA--[protein]-cysteine S-methyltransferase [Cephaloticoccus sp.]MCF7761254.1 methylated-DNA--[protein]-cysteine S-methyltransferase [Cephaloticoccus sp.]
MTIYTHTFSTPTGLFSVAVNDGGALVATAFGDMSILRTRIKANATLVENSRRTAEVRRQVRDYFKGKLRQFDLLLAPTGTPFQHAVWSALQRIPFGRTVSYGDLAKTIKRPSAARAVGRANGTNPICLIVPCHRVIGADGALTGFAFGEKTKLDLLKHEGALPRSKHTPRGA